ncbi:MAG: hypothetical protein ACRENE_25825 [Polyangiaceae bacterium]
MSAAPLPFLLAPWWRGILRRDDQATERASSLLACVFCHAPLEAPIRAALRDQSTGGAMIAWWEEDRDESRRIVAAGLYCHGLLNDERCCALADAPGLLLDTHAEYATGRRALPELARIIGIYPKWDGDALRRLGLIFAELARLPATKGKP